MNKHYREPILHTCPDIDKLIKGINEIEKINKNYNRIDNAEELKDIISEIENILSNFEEKLEELRRSNDLLRNWGILEAEEVDKLEYKLSEI